MGLVFITMGVSISVLTLKPKFHKPQLVFKESRHGLKTSTQPIQFCIVRLCLKSNCVHGEQTLKNCEYHFRYEKSAILDTELNFG